MSSISRWANTRPLTIWRKGAKNEYGEFAYGQPEYCLCSYRVGGKERYTDQKGIDFIPKITFWTEFLSTDRVNFIEPVKYGDKVALGILTGDPTPLADDIRMITEDDAAMFGANEKPDYTIGI